MCQRVSHSIAVSPKSAINIVSKIYLDTFIDRFDDICKMCEDCAIEVALKNNLIDDFEDMKEKCSYITLEERQLLWMDIIKIAAYSLG